MVKNSALPQPYFKKQPRAYSEQVGVNRQACGRKGEKYFLYKPIKKMKK